MRLLWTRAWIGAGLAPPPVVVDNGAVAPRTEHPIFHGLVALVCVAGSISLLLGLGALLATKGLGLAGAPENAAVDSTDRGSQTMYLPKPDQTRQRTGPLVTLLPGDEPESGSTGSVPPATTTAGIVLAAVQTSVTPLERIDLTGSYAAGEGAVLQVQRFDGGGWQDFPVTALVSGGTFSTYIQTSLPGPTRFRMTDTDTGATSNEIVVTVG